MKKKEMLFLRKMLGIATLLGEEKPMKLLIHVLGINPFKICLDGMTSFQISCQRSSKNMIDFITQFDFYYIGGGKTFDLNRQISKTCKKDKNSGIHYAALKDIPKNYEAIKNINTNILGQFNGRNWFPFECSRNPSITKSGVEFKETELRNKLLEFKNELITDTGRVNEAFGKLQTDYIYVIICRDIESDPEKTLVFEQLNRINVLNKDDETNKREKLLINNNRKRRILTQNTINQNEVIEETIIISGGVNNGDEDDFDDEDMELKGGNVDTFNPSNSNTSLINETTETEPLLGPTEHKWKVFDGMILKVKWIQLLNHEAKNRDYFLHCFLIGIEEQYMPEIADYMNLLIFNKKKGFPETFMLSKKKDFENFRDCHKQKMVLHLLKHELDLEDFKRRGIIEQYYPFHDFRRMHYINTSWQKEKYRTIIDNLKPSSTDLGRLNPFNALNFYHGSEVALYMGFNSVYTSWLLLMGIFGVLCVILQFSYKYDYDNKFLPIYAAIISIIITLAQQFWERRQNEFSYLWNTIDYKENEQVQNNFIGNFSIDQLRRIVIVENRWPAQSRRYLTDIVMAILGVGLIIANFIMFFFINQQISHKLTDNEITATEATYLSLLSGAGNGSVVFILDKVFRYLATSIVAWENHKYKSDQIMSKVPKLFFFNFAMNYINLFFYAFYLQDFVVLQSNFISMFITKNVLHFGLMNVFPWALYVINNFLLLRKYKRERAKRKKAFLNNLKMNIGEDISFEKLTKTHQEEVIRMEGELLLWEAVEVSIIQPNPLPMEDIWLNYMLQFGFIAFFSITFPLAPIIGFIFNLIDMNFVFFSFSRVFKRETIVELDSIGVWNEIIHGMTIVSLIVNIALFAWCSKAFEKLAGNELSGYYLLLALVIYEHVVFIIKFISSILIKSKPVWLENQLKHRKIKEQMYKESANQKKLTEKKISEFFKNQRDRKLKDLFPKIRQNNIINLIKINKDKKDGQAMKPEKIERDKLSDDQATDDINDKLGKIKNLDLEDEENEEENLLEFQRVNSIGFQNQVDELDLTNLIGKRLNKINFSSNNNNDSEMREELEENLLFEDKNK
jgi:hypothetical protein